MAVYIIAEIGVNHNGDLSLAKQLIEQAKFVGADAVKFQTWITEDIIEKNANKAEYQKTNNFNSESQYEMLKNLEFSFSEFEYLKSYCDEIGIEFLSTPDDINCANFLYPLQDKFKIGSGEIDNLLFLKKIAKLGKPVILSTGISDLEEVKQALNSLEEGGLQKSQITLMHVTSDYPAAYSEVNLNAMITMKNIFKCPIGYSDHTKGIEVSIAAVSLGAIIIEKHFTLDRNLEGPDHKASLIPKEFKMMVESIRNIEKSLGSGKKLPTPSELRNREIIRKKIFYKSSFSKGHKLVEDDLIMMRTSLKNAIPASKYNLVLGKKLLKDVNAFELIKKEQIS